MNPREIPSYETEPMPNLLISDHPTRSAWIEIDIGRLRNNLAMLTKHKPKGVHFLSVVKDAAYGHGALPVARAALAAGAAFLALTTLEEADALRRAGIRCPILMLGEREESELPWCVEHNLTICVSEPKVVAALAKLAAEANRRLPVHLKVNTGMNRYGIRWTEAPALARLIDNYKSLNLEGVLSHFAMSDEPDKTFAQLQLERLRQVLAQMEQQGVQTKYRHICNSGGFLDLPEAHLNMVRIGILQYGVYPSKTCRRLPGIEPTMSVKARVSALQHLQPGDTVGYGMRYQASTPRRIAVIPAGYGDGYPRVRNQGWVLLGGHRAPVVGGVAMDAFMVDITDHPEVQVGHEAVLMGRQGAEEISVHDLAQWKSTVSYEVLTGWRSRLPRVYINGGATA